MTRSVERLLSAILVGALTVPSPAFALRPTSVRQNNGLEEEIHQALHPGLAGGLEETPTGDSSEHDLWRAGEIGYHFHIVETETNRDSVLGALEAIVGLVKRRGNYSATPPQEVMDVLLERFAEESRPAQKGQLLTFLITLSYRRPEVWSALFSLMDSPREYEEAFSTDLLSTATKKVWKTSDRATVVGYIKGIVSLVFVEDASNTFYRSALRTIAVLLVQKPTLAEHFLADEAWVARLSVLAGSDDPMLAADAEFVVNRLTEESVVPETPGGAVEFLIQGASSGQTLTKLNAGMRAQLADQLKASGYAPSGLLREAFEQGARIVFVQANLQFTPTTAMINDMVSLVDEGWLTHLALPLKPSDRAAFSQFMAGEDDPKFLDELHSSFGWGTFTSDYPEEVARSERANERLRDVLRQLESQGVQFVFFAGDAAVTGELAFELEVGRLYEPFRRGETTRMLVYGPLTGWGPHNYGRVNLNGTVAADFTVSRSYATELANRFHDRRSVVSIIEQTTEVWNLQTLMSRIHNLGIFLEEHPVTRDVGIRVAGTALESVRFNEHYRERFGEAWDAVILRAKGDDGDEDETPLPEPVEPKREPVPTPSPVLILAPSAFERLAGLEEVVQALRRTAVGPRVLVIPASATPEQVRSVVEPATTAGARVVIAAERGDPVAELAARALAQGPAGHRRKIPFITPETLESWVLHILHNVGTLGAAGLEQAGQEFLDAVGLEAAA